MKKNILNATFLCKGHEIHHNNYKFYNVLVEPSTITVVDHLFFEKKLAGKADSDLLIAHTEMN